jgi:azurin
MKKLFCFFTAVSIAVSINGAQKVTITGNDTMQFDTKEFEVKSGEKVELEFKNVGKLPKIAMGHNLVILKQGISSLKFGQQIMGMGASATNPLPEASMKDVIAATKLLGPGETEIIAFTAPDPGEYQFVCTFPGHFAMMRGIMVVK